MIAALAALTFPVASTPSHARSRLVTVPDLQQVEIRRAYAQLRARGLRVTIPFNLYLAPYVRTEVMAQEPAGQSRAPRGSVVRITRVEGRRHARPAGDTTERVVPELRRLSAHGAVELIEVTGFRYWTATLRGPLRASRGLQLLGSYRVRSQRPAGGTLLRQREDFQNGYSLTPIAFVARPI